MLLIGMQFLAHIATVTLLRGKVMNVERTGYDYDKWYISVVNSATDILLRLTKLWLRL
jgi:hypothetical protein